MFKNLSGASSLNSPPSLAVPYRKADFIFGFDGEEDGFFVTPTFLGIVEPGVPVALAQGPPLRLVPEDGHPARGLGLIKLHLGTAGIGLHPADGGRGGCVWGQGTAAVRHRDTAAGTGASVAAGHIQQLRTGQGQGWGLESTQAAFKDIN